MMEATVTLYQIGDQIGDNCQNGWCGGKSYLFTVMKSFQSPEDHQVVFEID